MNRPTIVNYDDLDFRSLGGTHVEDPNSLFYGRELRKFGKYQLTTLVPPISDQQLAEFYKHSYAKNRSNNFKFHLRYYLKAFLCFCLPPWVRKKFPSKGKLSDDWRPTNPNSRRSWNQFEYIRQHVGDRTLESCVDFGAGNGCWLGF